MPDHEFGEGLAVKENAMPAISQIRNQLADTVIAIVDHPPDSCCKIGFHALPVPRSELPGEGFNNIGMLGETEVAAQLGARLDAVYKRLSRLHQSLRTCIETKLAQPAG